MRTYLKWAILMAFLCTLAYLVWGFTTKLERKKAIAKRTQTLPSCTVQGISGDTFTLTSAGKPTVLIYFEPDCEHCQREARELRNEYAALAEANLVLLSAAPVPALKTFVQTYQLASVPGLRMAHIDRQVAHDTFGFVSVPDVLIYHADGTLSHRFKGETSITAIAKRL
ncbi:peroxiredoxin family protein [Fibrella forsythiae]|uniref:Redoxin domain-containing protein n=1 Tax=Fibrella forsythiae TaxID=2817061 RepID=A0ABS3JJV0_9BACT|nr:redoxin domain-containing protein [Fibrella forsythiae]MBO0949529.1 redoxin domain-containing protein [Fibrella forsythiae]